MLQVSHTAQAMSTLLRPCRSLIVSEKNLRLLGTNYSYRDYEEFFEKELEPLDVSPEPLLDEPEIITQEEEEDVQPATNSNQPAANDDDPLFNDLPQQQNSGYMEFDDDFWR